jgi:hypothetical protein
MCTELILPQNPGTWGPIGLKSSSYTGTGTHQGPSEANYNGGFWGAGHQEEASCYESPLGYDMSG